MPTEKTMTLITTFWGEGKTFKMIPTKKECPYLEVLFDTTTQMLVVFSKSQVEKLQMVPRLNDDGEPIIIKQPKPNRAPYKQKQISMTVPQEHFIIEEDEIIKFVEKFADNAEEFNFKNFFMNVENNQPDIMEIKKPKIEVPGLVMADGTPTKTNKKTKDKK